MESPSRIRSYIHNPADPAFGENRSPSGHLIADAIISCDCLHQNELYAFIVCLLGDSYRRAFKELLNGKSRRDVEKEWLSLFSPSSAITVSEDTTLLPTEEGLATLINRLGLVKSEGWNTQRALGLHSLLLAWKNGIENRGGREGFCSFLDGLFQGANTKQETAEEFNAFIGYLSRSRSLNIEEIDSEVVTFIFSSWLMHVIQVAAMLCQSILSYEGKESWVWKDVITHRESILESARDRIYAIHQVCFIY